jgi:hypothetical protein
MKQLALARTCLGDLRAERACCIACNKPGKTMNTMIKIILTVICAMPMLAWAGEQQKANEQIVLDFIDAMDSATSRAAVGEVPKIVEKFWTENCVQHRAGVARASGHHRGVAELADVCQTVSRAHRYCAVQNTVHRLSGRSRDPDSPQSRNRCDESVEDERALRIQRLPN